MPQPDCFNFPIIPPILEDPFTTPGSILDTAFHVTYFCDTIRVDSIRTKGSPWLQILTSPDSFTIFPEEPPLKIDIRLDATALLPSTYIDTIIIFNDSSVEPRAVLPVHFVVSDCGYFRRSQVVATVGDLRVKFSNASNLGDQDPFNGFYLTSINEKFLFDGSNVITSVTADGDTIAAKDFAYLQSFKPLSSIDTQTVTLQNLFTFGEALQQQRPAGAGAWLKIGPVNKAMFFPDLKSPDIPWPGHWFKYQISETWWIKAIAKPRYVLWFTKIFKADPPCWWPVWPGELLVNNIYAGSVMDWNLPSDSGVVNSGAYNDTFKILYQRGRRVPYNKYYAGIAALVDTGFHLKDSTVYNSNGLFGAHILSNVKYGQPTGIFADTTLNQWFSKPGVKHDFVPNHEDISSILTSVCFDTTADTVSYAQALVVSNLGFDSLYRYINNARYNMKLDTILPYCDCYKSGDANGNGAINLADIIFLVNYVYKGGPAPTQTCQGDYNNSGTINLTDIVASVNFIFKGGPSPAPSGVCIL